ncbi:chorion peroxidase isoform X2 [Phlebotomus papatasi]|uniref:chorion peroxidase isoform X2 n=1 Tax=Phlebotomus papatasi TaxID=29031 RepID=UPI002484299D|nr:chorion peroxidase isoform X2 [Phlebotomus papatasi]
MRQRNLSLFCGILSILIVYQIFGVYSFKLYRSSAQENQLNNKKAGFTPVPNLPVKKSGLLVKYDPCPSTVRCVPPIQCPAHVNLPPEQKPHPCELSNGLGHGLCCTTGQNHTAQKTQKHHHLHHHGAREVSLAELMSKARDQFVGLQRRALLAKAHKIKPGNPEFAHNSLFHTNDRDKKRINAMTDRAMQEVIASRLFRERESISVRDFLLNNFNGALEGASLESDCQSQDAPCHSRPRPYRLPDGTCNNPLPGRTSWAAAGTPHLRLLPPAYVDGIWEPRLTSATGQPLPSTRDISRFVFPDVDRPHPTYNLMVMLFGQFISHDITQTASITNRDGTPISCCSEDGSRPLPPSQSHFACMPIPISPDDEFYAQFNQGCMNFVRSAIAPNCRLGSARQIDRVTHYLDGSPIYGSDEQTEADLRAFEGGRLRMLNDFGRDLLPLSNDVQLCSQIPPGSTCFQAGDTRTNQIISITAMHTLFAREHNRVATRLAQLNPHWSDDLLFVEAKRIVVAELQYIAYNEWLPLIIGTETMARFDLNVRPDGYSDDYSADINAAVTSEFITAAFRFGHSTVDGVFRTFSETIEIPDVMFEPSRLLQRSFYDDILVTMTSQPMQEVDSSVTNGLSQFMFRGTNPFGLDLVSINLQRARDHGLRTYNEYLELTGSRKIGNFEDLGPEIAERLQRAYASPDDIELWVGGLLESAQVDALLGPTFSEIIADQFSRFRRGDRYFFEHSPEINPGAFTPQQIAEVRKTSMARLLCDNSDGIFLQAAQPQAFLQPTVNGNDPVSCDSNAILRVDLSAWQEE